MGALRMACYLAIVLQVNEALPCPDNQHDFNELEVFIDPPFSEYATRYIKDPNLELPQSLCSVDSVPVVIGTYFHPSSTLPQKKDILHNYSS